MGCYSGSGEQYNQQISNDGWLYKSYFSGFLSKDIPDPPNLPPNDNVTIDWTTIKFVNLEDPFLGVTRNGFTFLTSTYNVARTPFFQINVFCENKWVELLYSLLPATGAGEYGWTVKGNIEVTAANKWRIYGSVTSSLGSVSFDETAPAELPDRTPTSVQKYQVKAFYDARTATHPSNGDWSYCSDGDGGTPDHPILIYPGNCDTDVKAKPAFLWNAAAGADTYRIQASTESGFGSTVIDQSGLSALTYTPANNLGGLTLHYWRVNATNVNGTSSWSAVWEFTTRDLPGIPVLRSPANSAADVNLVTVFRWYASSLAVSYTLELSTDSGFVTSRIKTGITNVFLNSGSWLELGTTYYWRVKAINSEGISAWSAEWSFTTLSTLPEKDCPYVDNRWSFNCNILADLGGGSYRISAGHHRNITAFLCSNDSLAGATRAVALRTKDGQWFVTVCDRINYGGKTFSPTQCDDPYCRALMYLFYGEDQKGGGGGKLDSVTVGQVVISTAEVVLLNSVIGQIRIANDYGSALETGSQCVILNLDSQTNTAKVLGPAE